MKLAFSTIDVFDYTVAPKDSETSIIYITSNSTINTRNSYGNSEIVYYTSIDAEESLDSIIYRWFKIDNSTYIEVLKEGFAKNNNKQIFQNTYQNIKVINILMDTNCDLFNTEVNQIEISFSYLFLVFDDTVNSNIKNLINEHFRSLYPNFKERRDGDLLGEAN